MTPATRRPRAGRMAAVVIGAASLLGGVGARADDYAPYGTGAGARPAEPVPARAPSFRVDDGRLNLGCDPCAGRVQGPVGIEQRAPIKAIPYRVEPQPPSWPPSSPWDLPPERPDPRDFEQVQTYDELSNPQYELREEIWATPEDFVGPWGQYGSWGLTREGGIAYVPYWARNTVRYGRVEFFPWVQGEAIWHSNPKSEAGSGHSAYEFLVSAGTLAEYWVTPGHTKIKGVARGDYHSWDKDFSDAATFLLGTSIEHRLNRYVTISAGVEWERDYLAVDRNASLFTDNSLIERIGAYADLAWDRFLSDDLRLVLGGSWEHYNEVKSAEHGGDHDDLGLYVRAETAVMRHESFAYGEYRFTTRNATGPSSDLNQGHEVRFGFEDVLPQGLTRRLVGNVWGGFSWEDYGASTVGSGHSRHADTWTAGADLTYKPSPYTSAYLSYEHGHEFSAVSNYNTVDSIHLAITQNLSHRLIGRLGVSWTRVEPQDQSATERATAGAGLRYALSDNLDLMADYEYTYRWAGAGLPNADGHRVALGATWYLR